MAKIPYSCVIFQRGGPDPLPPPPLDPRINQTHLKELSGAIKGGNNHLRII